MEISAIQSTSAALPQEAVQEAVSALPNVSENLFKEIPSDQTEAFYASTTAVEIPADEYAAIRADQELSFSSLIDKHGLEKTLSVLSVETLKQKFDAEFGQLPDAETLKTLDLAKFEALNKHGIISDEMMGKIREAFAPATTEPSAPVAEVVSVEVVEIAAPVAAPAETAEPAA